MKLKAKNRFEVFAKIKNKSIFSMDKTCLDNLFRNKVNLSLMDIKLNEIFYFCKYKHWDNSI